MLEWLTLLADNWQFGVLLLSLLPPIVGLAHMIYFIYIAPDDDEDDDAVPGAGNNDGVAAAAIHGGVPQRVRAGKKKHKRKHT
jgi:hypothetical protein